MAFLRFNRDTRGYEHFYLVHPTTNRRGKVRPKLLYWFRSPPNVKVGRQPFDDAVRRALEAQNPDVHFDWQSIVDTPIPPPVEEERWRERRRFERAARQAAEETRSDAGDPGGASEPRDALVDASAASLPAPDMMAPSVDPVEDIISDRELQTPPALLADIAEPWAPGPSDTPGEQRTDAAQHAPLEAGRRKRRRRRGRRGHPA